MSLLGLDPPVETSCAEDTCLVVPSSCIDLKTKLDFDIDLDLKLAFKTEQPSASGSLVVFTNH